MIKTTTTPEAWEVAYKIADAGEYELDKDSQERAGYPIYRTKENFYSYICDLGCALEVVKADGTTTKIWIEPKEPAAEEPAHYGDALAEKIRETTTDFSKISHFDKFVLDRGYKYKTEGELKVAYDRAWRASHNILITLEDFLAETEKKPDEPAADKMAQEQQLDEVTISEYPDLFVRWDENWRGKAGDIVQDEGQLYRSIHDVKDAGQNRKPSETPSMWTRIGNPLEEFPEWVQPIGAHDAYDVGVKVAHGGKRWVSTAPSNVWEPGVYGWTEYVEPAAAAAQEGAQEATEQALLTPGAVTL